MFFSDFYFFIALLCENGNMLTWLFVNQCENGKSSVEHDLVKAHQMGCYNVSYSLVLVFSFSPHFIYLFILRNCHNWKFADLQLTALFNQWVYSVFINIWSQLTQYIDVLCKAKSHRMISVRIMSVSLDLTEFWYWGGLIFSQIHTVS